VVNYSPNNKYWLLVVGSLDWLLCLTQCISESPPVRKSVLINGSNRIKALQVEAITTSFSSKFGISLLMRLTTDHIVQFEILEDPWKSCVLGESGLLSLRPCS
jgi:hypothetical protein